MADLFENELQMINYAVPSIGDSFWDDETEKWVYPGGGTREDIDFDISGSASSVEGVDPAEIPVNFRKQNYEYLRKRNKNMLFQNSKFKEEDWPQLYEVNTFSYNDANHVPTKIRNQCYKEFEAYAGVPKDYNDKRQDSDETTDENEYRSISFYTPPPVVLRSQQKYYMYFRGGNYYFLDLKQGPTGQGESVEYILRMFDKSSVYPKQANS